MKFAHMADCHIGAWRNEKLRALGHDAFASAVATCIQEQVDFVLIAGDLFHTALPSIESMHIAVKQLQLLKDAQIPVYIIPGSHDYTASGTSLIDVLESAELFTNVFKGESSEHIMLRITHDKKTGCGITGVAGKAGMLDHHIYRKLDTLQQQTPQSIFMFHTAIAELLEGTTFARFAQPLSLLPKGFTYYAGGHVHVRVEKKIPGYGTLVYPGPLFPADFSELERLRHGSFVIVDNGHVTFRTIALRPVVPLRIDVTNKHASDIAQELQKAIPTPLQDAIIVARFFGEHTQSIQELGLLEWMRSCYEKGAHVVLMNTTNITSPNFEEVYVEVSHTDVEKEIITHHDTGDFDNESVQQLLDILSVEQQEGENKTDYERRVVASALRLFDNKNDSNKTSKTSL